MRLVGLVVHPLKSAAGIPVTEAEVTRTGLRHDRRWMIVDATGRFVSQREDPRLGRIVPSLDGERMRLEAPIGPPLDLPLAPDDGEAVSVRIWSDVVEARSCGAKADAWVEALLGEGHRIVVLADDDARAVDPAYARNEDRVAFADGYPFLLATNASLDELNRRAGTRLEMARFRPNLIVGCAEPFAEDKWKALRIGDVSFRVVKPCVRCVVTTLDPATGEAGHEPLRTLATFRATDKGVTFGQNLLADGLGVLRVGDAVEAIEKG
jgi:hypothetical protein